MFGVLKEEFFPMRDYDYEIVCGSTGIEYPEKFELDRSLLGEVTNQGNVGACVAYAITQIARNYYNKDMSEGYVYGRFRKDTSKGYGMIVSDALKLYKDLGTIPKDMLDIVVEMPDMRKIINDIPELDKFAKQYPISGYVSMNYADKDKRDITIKDALIKQSKGEISGYGLLAVSNDYFREGHAIMLTGWDDTKDKYIFKNSWGENYGDKGYGTIPKNEINAVYLISFEGMELPFEDVPKDAWYYKDVKNMYNAGHIKGTSETTFDPDKFMTRAEVSALLNRVLGQIDDRFSIVNKVFNEKLK